MRIALFLPHPFPKGSAIASRIEKIGRCLIAGGHEAIVVPLHSEANPSAFRIDNHSIKYLIPRGSQTTKNICRSRLSVLSQTSRDFLESLEVIDQANPLDAVLCYGGSFWIYRLVHRYCNARSIPIVHDLTEWPPFRLRRLLSPRFLDQLVFRFLSVRKLAGALCISAPWAEECRSRGVKTLLVPALGEDQPSREPPPSPNDGEFRVVYLGPLSERDCPDHMLGGFQQLLSAHPSASFTIVGRADTFASGRNFRRTVESNARLASAIRFLGYVSDEEVARHLATASALLLVRRNDWESRCCFPTRLPEYLLSAAPVVISDVGDVANYLDNERNVLLANPSEGADGIARLLLRLANNPELVATLRRNGPAAAIQQFSVSSHAQRISSLFSRLPRRQR